MLDPDPYIREEPTRRGRREAVRTSGLVTVAADIPAGLAYLAIGLGFAALDVVVIRYGGRFARDRRRTSWMSGRRSPGWQETRGVGTARTFSIAGVLMLSLIALLMVISAVAEFRR
jgi:hypothetical protein